MSDGKAVFKALWARAPWWRTCLIAATLLSVAVVFFPPSMGTTNRNASPALPEQVAYQPQRSPPTLPSQQGRATPSTANISLATSGAASSQDPSGLDRAMIGRTYSGTVRVDGYEVPLPTGQWAMLANSSIRLPKASGMIYFFGRIEKKRLIGAVRIIGLKSNESPGDGFEQANGCVTGNPDLNYVFIESVKPFAHQGCWSMTNIYTPPFLQWADQTVKISSLDRAAAGDMAAKGVTYPQDFMVLRFFRAEKWGCLRPAIGSVRSWRGLLPTVCCLFASLTGRRGTFPAFPKSWPMQAS
ncbi:hypothetical protein [Pseudomonas sp. TH31]|uniref:hypothetical protein n=1 Tax=Pseudomonas sp. TH31 TaxID=2796396 RepID=UPI001911DC89|nr:hypothetical protein [Pseudomonas sp. TH31]MBK5417407.1 hypothetical protein [Pseudomonas sp. TH31]